MYRESVITIPVDVKTDWLSDYISKYDYSVESINFDSTLNVKFLVIYDNGEISVKPIMVSDMLLVNNKGVTVEDGFMQTK